MTPINYPPPQLSDGDESRHASGDQLQPPTIQELDSTTKTGFWMPVPGEEGSRMRKTLGKYVWAFQKAIDVIAQDDRFENSPTNPDLKLLFDAHFRNLEKMKLRGDAFEKSSEEVIMSRFPKGYALFHYLFETKSDRETRRGGGKRTVSRAGKNKFINGVNYRVDPYILGHPGGSPSKFRSAQEMRPHMAWLQYAYYACSNQGTPSDIWGWSSRDFHICGCISCSRFVAKSRDFYQPLRYAITLSAAGAPLADHSTPLAHLRPLEYVLLRIIVDDDGNIKPAEPKLPSLVMKFAQSQPLPTGNNEIFWPAEIIGRKSVLDGTAITMKKNSKKMITSSMAEDIEETPAEEVLEQPLMTLYSVKLLGGVVMPATAGEPLVFNDALQALYARSTEWRQLSKYAVLWGTEVIRVGDLVRLKRDPDEALHVLEIQGSSDNLKLRGTIWKQNRQFSFSFDFDGVMMPSWLPSHEYMLDQSIDLTGIAGRLYPINHDGLYVKGYSIASLWQDWQGVFTDGKTMNVISQSKDVGTELSWDFYDSDIARKSSSTRMIAGRRQHHLQIEFGSVSASKKRKARKSSEATSRATTDDESNTSKPNLKAKKLRVGRRKSVKYSADVSSDEVEDTQEYYDLSEDERVELDALEKASKKRAIPSLKIIFSRNDKPAEHVPSVPPVLPTDVSQNKTTLTKPQNLVISPSISNTPLQTPPVISTPPVEPVDSLETSGQASPIPHSIFTCGIEECGRIYTRKGQLDAHQREKWKKCDHCDLKFHRVKTMANHIKEAHGKKLGQMSDTATPSPRIEPSKEPPHTPIPNLPSFEALPRLSSALHENHETVSVSIEMDYTNDENLETPSPVEGLETPSSKPINPLDSFTIAQNLVYVDTIAKFTPWSELSKISGIYNEFLQIPDIPIEDMY
ncbi:hypothetical protein HDU97_003116 [Phlyctochytrium planicorne]|nr:hypothetical protein HDU97_003067 [Phlyctochytrium planicorne]KAJ3109687.1 hypothetical protein HDU97_003116 [Phlyctochytrium planicorne]